MPSEPDDGDDGVAIAAGGPATAATIEPDAPTGGIGPPVPGGPVVVRPERARMDPAKLKAAAERLVQLREADEGTPAIDATATSSPTTPPPVVEAAPTPQTPPDVAAAWEHLTARESQLIERETRLTERETGALAHADGLLSDPHAVIVAQVRHLLGPDASDDEVDAEIADIVTGLSLKLSGATIPPDNLHHQLRAQRRDLRHLKLDRRRAERTAAESAKTEAGKAERATAIGALTDELTATKVLEKTPWLAASENPAEAILTTMRGHYQRTGVVLPLAKAAELADADVRKENLPKLQRFTRLLQPQPTPTAAKPTETQGDHQRRSISLSNAAASDDAPPDNRTEPMTPEERRKRTLDKWRPKFKEGATTE